MADTEKAKSIDNGVNVEALLGAREALSEAPEAAQFQWRAKCEWVQGTHSRSTVEGFFGLGEEQSHRSQFTFDADHPEIFASEDHGATPVEIVLASLASCLTAGIASVAQLREIQLNSVTATVEGGMDIQGILGMDSDVRNGFEGIKVWANTSGCPASTAVKTSSGGWTAPGCSTSSIPRSTTSNGSAGCRRFSSRAPTTVTPSISTL